jgi:outer membrane protein TolC
MNIIKITIIYICSSVALAMGEAEFIAKLQQHHPFFTEQTLTLRSKETAKHIANPYTQWNLKSNIQHLDSQNVLTNTIEKQNLTGGSLNITHSVTDNFDSSTTPYNNSLEITYSLPLLKNSNGINNKLNLDVAILDEKIANLQYSIDSKSFINSMLKKFYTLQFLKHKEVIVRTQQAIEKKQLELLQERFANNLVDKADVLLQTNNYQTSHINLANLNQELADITQELQHAVGVNVASYDAEFTITTTPKIPTTRTFATQELTALKILDLQQHKYKRELQSLYNQERLQMDVSIGAKTDRVGSSALGGNIQRDNSVSIGLTIALPLAGDNNTHLITQKQQQLAILQTQKQQKIIDLNTQYTSITSQLKNLQTVIQINKEQVEIAKQKVGEFEKLYRDNNTELNFLINARSSQKAFELNYLNNILSYKKLQLDYELLIQ